MNTSLASHTLAWCELDTAFRSNLFHVKWSSAPWETAAALRLRRDVFCGEQAVFEGNDLDAIDHDPGSMRTLVALSCLAGEPDQLVGTVRIHEADEGLWWGSRLAVAPAFRQIGGIGATLIRLAVCSAHAQGCRSFLAHVQVQNVSLFQRMQWRELTSEHLHGRPHALMEADLSAYPPCHDPWTGFTVDTARRRR